MRFIDFMANSEWPEPNSKRTPLYQTTLDIFFIINPTCVYNTNVILGISADEHHAVYIEYNIKPKRNKEVPREIKLYSKTGWEASNIECQPF